MTNNSNQKSNKSSVTASFASILLLGVILLAVNSISGFTFFRADLTSEKLFTLSNGTKSALGKLKDKTKLKFYFSKSMGNVPFQYKLYGKKIEEFLGEYVENGKGMIELEVLDPKPDTDIEEWAVKYGLAAAGLPTGEKFYFGLVAIVADKEEIIPFFTFDREEFLEYDITRSIVQVAAPKKANIGILSTLPVLQKNNTPSPMAQPGKEKDWLFTTELKKNFNVRAIDINTEVINGDIDLLMVIHPKKLPESTVYAIDQFVIKGGRAIIMVDPTCLGDTSQGGGNPYMAMMNRSSDLPKLFKAWGIEYNPGKIAADVNLGTQLNMGANGVVNHPLWLSLKGNTFNRKSTISAKLNSMLLPNAGIISQAKTSEYEFTSLLNTSDTGAEVDMFKALSSPPDAIKRELPDTGSSKTLAALVKGKFNSAFTAPPSTPAPKDEKEPAKKARELKDESKKKQHIAKASNPCAVMVIADTDFLQDNYSVKAVNFFGRVLLQPLNNNLTFISNCSDLLAGSADLIAVRSRNRSNRTFTKVEQIEREAQQKWKKEETILTKKLEEIQARINKLQSQKKGGERLILSAQQREEILKARQEKTETMRSRRKIRKLLRQDIESLGTKVAFINLLFMPILIILTGSYIYFKQNTRRAML